MAGNHTQSWNCVPIAPIKCPETKKEGAAIQFTVAEVGDPEKAQNEGRKFFLLFRQRAPCPICFPRLFYKVYIYTPDTSGTIGIQKPTVLNNCSASSSPSLKQNLQISSSWLTNTGFNLRQFCHFRNSHWIFTYAFALCLCIIHSFHQRFDLTFT